MTAEINPVTLPTAVTQAQLQAAAEALGISGPVSMFQFAKGEVTVEWIKKTVDGDVVMPITRCSARIPVKWD